MAFDLYDLDQGHTKPATDTKVRDVIGRGGGMGLSNVSFFRQAAEPTPVENKINLWYDTDDGHLYLYNDVNVAWYRLTGFM